MEGSFCVLGFRLFLVSRGGADIVNAMQYRREQGATSGGLGSLPRATCVKEMRRSW